VEGAYLAELCRLSVADGKSRFVPPAIVEKYDFDLPEYEGVDQVVEVGSNGQKL